MLAKYIAFNSPVPSVSPQGSKPQQGRLSSALLKHVLVLDDDDVFLRAVCTFLEDNGGFSVLPVSSIAEARKQSNERMFDAYILDVNLDDGDGRDFCMELRERGLVVPIVMLTALGDESNTIDGLEAGATDYISKPVRPSILIAKLYALLRQAESAEDVSYEFGQFVFKPKQKQLHNRSTSMDIRLTEKEVVLLGVLLRSRGRMVPRGELLRRGWGYSRDINTHTLETHVYRLRQKINQSCPSDDYVGRSVLQTENGGYRLNLR